VNTIGMAEVACLIAGTAVPIVTSTLSWTNSAAISDKRSLRPSPQRFDPDGAPLDPTEFAQSLHKGGSPRRHGGSRCRP
jgi:hypothetical protein